MNTGVLGYLALLAATFAAAIGALFCPDPNWTTDNPDFMILGVLFLVCLSFLLSGSGVVTRFVSSSAKE